MSIDSGLRISHPTRHAGIFVLAIAVSALLLPALSGCGSLYLHSDDTQQATAKAKTELDKLNVNALFDNEAAYLDDLQVREYSLVAESLTARRDVELLTILGGIDSKDFDGDGRAMLGSYIDGQLRGLVGFSDRGMKGKLTQTINDARSKVSKDKSLAKALSEALVSHRSQSDAPAGGATLDTAIQKVADAADAKIKLEGAAKERKAQLKGELEQAAKEFSAGQQNREAFDKLLGKVHGFLEKAKAEAKANPYLGELVTDSLKEHLDKLVEVTDPKGLDKPGDSKARAAIGFAQAAFSVGDAFSNPPRVPHPNALAAAQSWLRYEASLADVSLKQAQSQEAALNARMQVLIKQVHYLSLAGQELADILDDPPHKDGEGFARLLESKDRGQARHASAALYYFAAAWNEGLIPAQQIDQVSMELIERRAKLQSSRLSGEAWLGALKPAVATLAAYGEGGLDPHILAELLQVLGIGAIAVGVN